jgi:hypothetical protein
MFSDLLEPSVKRPRYYATVSQLSFHMSSSCSTTAPAELENESNRELIDTLRKHVSGLVAVVCCPRAFDLQASAEVIKEFMEMTAKDESTGISDDVIVIEVSGSTLPSLALIDLPGLVQCVGDGADSGRIEQIKNMVKGYMKQILTVFTSGTVIDNQEVIKLAKEADYAGNRTMTILNKANILAEGEYDMYKDLL